MNKPLIAIVLGFVISVGMFSTTTLAISRADFEQTQTNAENLVADVSGGKIKFNPNDPQYNAGMVNTFATSRDALQNILNESKIYEEGWVYGENATPLTVMEYYELSSLVRRLNANIYSFDQSNSLSKLPAGYDETSYKKDLQDAGNYESALAKAADANYEATKESLKECGTLDTPCKLLKMVDDALEALLWLVGQVLKLVNWLFNKVFDLSVRQFNVFYESPGIKIAWGVVRDLVNVTLLFVLLYAALGLVLEVFRIDSKNIVKNVILVALLINFSYFLTGVVIKASNTVANTLYSQVDRNKTGDGTPDLTSSILALSGDKAPPALPNNPPDTSTNIGKQTFGGILGSFVGKFVLIIILVISLGAAMVMFSVRLIKLIGILVLSPLAFLGFAIGGKLKGKADEWLHTLFNLCIFPVVFLVFLLVITKMAELDVIKQAGQTGAGFFANLAGAFIMAIVINGILIFGLMASSALGASGAGWAVNRMKGLGQGVRGWAGRNSYGRLANFTGRNLNRLGRRMQESRGGRIALRALRYGTLGGGDALLGEVNRLGAGRREALEARGRETAEGLRARRDIQRQAAYLLGRPRADQERAYAQMGVRERADLEMELERQGQGAIAEHLRGRLSPEERERVVEARVQPSALNAAARAQTRAAPLGAAPTTAGQVLTQRFATMTPEDRQVAYNRISARDRVEVERTLTPAEVTALRQGLTADELEKTERAQREVQQGERNRQIRNVAEAYAAGGGGAPPIAALDDPNTGIQRLPNDQAHRLNHEARMNIDIIQRLSPQQLGNLMAQGDLQDNERRAILAIINGPTAYPRQAAQRGYVSSGPNAILWTP